MPNDDGCHLSLAAHDLLTGRTWGSAPEGRYLTASVGKIAILTVLLVQAQAAGRELTAEERALAEKMITVSDNDAAHTLWRATGRDTAMAAVNAALGLTETTTTPESWGLTRTSAADQVRLVTALAAGTPVLDRARCAYVLDLMAAVDGDQRWGLDAALRPGDRLAVKNGWLDYSGDDGRWTVNSVGRITGEGRDLVLAVMSNDHATLEEGIRAVRSAAATVIT